MQAGENIFLHQVSAQNKADSGSGRQGDFPILISGVFRIAVAAFDVPVWSDIQGKRKLFGAAIIYQRCRLIVVKEMVTAQHQRVIG